MSTSGGTNTRTNRAGPMVSAAAIRRGGASSGFQVLTATTYTAKAPAISRPGINAPMNRSPTDTPSWSPSTTSTIEGGMIWPRVPEAAITPLARERS